MSTPAVVNDPWLDPFTTLGRESAYFQDLSQIATESGFGTPDAPAEGAPDAPLDPLTLVPPTPEAPSTTAPEPEEPRVYPVDGGGTLTLEKGSKGWQATLNAGVEGVKDQVYYGKTKDELFLSFGKAQLHATKKIRSQDQKLKLGDPAPAAPTPPAPQPNQPVAVRQLTADEAFEFKTLFDADPIRAMDFYNERRFGLTPDQFAQRLNEPLAVRQQVSAREADAIAYRFVDANKDFYPDPNGRNYLQMVKYMGRQYLQRAVNANNIGKTVEDLFEAGFWTVENLEAAKDDLNASEFLLMNPATSTPAPVLPAPAAVIPQAPQGPPAPPAAIPATERPRAANLGLRVQPGPPVAPSPSEALSVDNPDNMTDADLDALMHNLRQSRARSR